MLLGKQSESQSPDGSSCQWQHVVANVEACHRLWTADAVKCMCELGVGVSVGVGVGVSMGGSQWAGVRWHVWIRVCYQLVGCCAVGAVNAFSRFPDMHLPTHPLVMLKLALGHRQH